MKTVKKSLLFWLFAFFLTLGSSEARDFIVRPFSVDGLARYAKSNVTLYLVSASKVFGAEFTVSKVFKVLSTVAVNGQDSIYFGEIKVKQNWSSFRNPNAIVVVVHDQPKHALNKHGVVDGTPTIFAEPEYQNAGEKVPLTDENIRLRQREAATFTELLQNPSIRI